MLSIHRQLKVAAWVVLALIAVDALSARAGQSVAGIPRHVVHDEQIEEQLLQAGARMIAAGRAPKMSVLAGQLSRKTCALKLPRPAAQKTAALSATMARCRPGVLVVASLYRCASCTNLHVAPAAGFVLTAGGAFATCYHVVNAPDHEALVVLTGDGRVCGVREILAADETNDVAIGQLDGAGFTPLPLAADAPVGSRVLVFGHPEGQFYTLTEGIISRYFTGQKETGDAVMMSITADFAPGSSGCPVLNERGEVVALADNVVTAGSDNRTRIVFKNARPVDAIRKLIRP